MDIGTDMDRNRVTGDGRLHGNTVRPVKPVDPGGKGLQGLFHKYNPLYFYCYFSEMVVH